MGIEEIANRAAGYGFPGFRWSTAWTSYNATRRRGRPLTTLGSQGPVLLEMKVERFMSHTTDDDDRRYRPGQRGGERPRSATRSLPSAALLQEHGLITQERIDEIAADVPPDRGRGDRRGGRGQSSRCLDPSAHGLLIVTETYNAGNNRSYGRHSGSETPSPCPLPLDGGDIGSLDTIPMNRRRGEMSWR